MTPVEFPSPFGGSFFILNLMRLGTMITARLSFRPLSGILFLFEHAEKYWDKIQDVSVPFRGFFFYSFIIRIFEIAVTLYVSVPFRGFFFYSLSSTLLINIGFKIYFAAENNFITVSYPFFSNKTVPSLIFPNAVQIVYLSVFYHKHFPL